MRGGGEGESFGLAAAWEWGGGCTLSLEETESWVNVCAVRPRRACHTETREGVREDVVGDLVPSCCIVVVSIVVDLFGCIVGVRIVVVLSCCIVVFSIRHVVGSLVGLI